MACETTDIVQNYNSVYTFILFTKLTISSAFDVILFSLYCYILIVKEMLCSEWVSRS